MKLFEKNMMIENYYKIEHVTKCYVWVSYPSNNTRYTIKLKKHSTNYGEYFQLFDKTVYAI